jgi:DNA-binding response OmpR family regulator
MGFESDAVRPCIDVLLVEDDATLAQMYRIKLVAEGYQVRLAHDGPAGLEAALARLPDLLLLDLRLPGFGGLELLAQLRNAPGGDTLPVIVLSNYGEQETVDSGLDLGVLGHLIKSQTTPASLVATIRSSLPDPETKAPASI